MHRQCTERRVRGRDRSGQRPRRAPTAVWDSRVGAFAPLAPAGTSPERLLVAHLGTDWTGERRGRFTRLEPDTVCHAHFRLGLIHDFHRSGALLNWLPNTISLAPPVNGDLEPGGGDGRLADIFAAFNEAWMKYWASYTKLQDQLYESLRAGREVSWLAATDQEKLSEINQVQRGLFSEMPRRLDYAPLGEVTQGMQSAPGKIVDLLEALAREEEGCKELESAIALMKEKVDVMKKAMLAGEG